MARRLDYWAKADTFAWLADREADVFARYFELGSVKKLVEELGAQHNGLSKPTFYAWLRDTDERWETFEAIRETRAYDTAEEGYEIADGTTQQTANADRLKFEGKMRAAEHQNRNAFGKRPEVQVAVGVGGEWAAALEQAMSQARVAPSTSFDAIERSIEATHPSANGSTRASVPLLEPPKNRASTSDESES
jgi:hypothetical protein